jgi:ParB/RepB/Spo0J family partition protein
MRRRKPGITVVSRGPDTHTISQVPAIKKDVPLDLIDPSATQPRTIFDEQPLSELAASIRVHGVLQDIIVRPRGERYEVIAGERRVRASRLAGLSTIPAQIRDIDDHAARQVQIIENLQREGIHPLEEAAAYQSLLDADPACTPESIGIMVGKSKRYIYQCLTFLRLIPPARDAFARNVLTAAHAARLAQVPAEHQAEGLAECFFPVLLRRRQDDADPFDAAAFDADALAPVGNLDKWMQKIKLDPHSEDTRVLLPDLNEKVTHAETADKNTVLKLSTLHFHADKSDRTPILAQSWRQAEGDDRCKHARAGVIVLGDGRGTVLRVCIEKKKCNKHWKVPRANAAESRRKEQAAAEELARERREADARAQREQKFYAEHFRPAIIAEIGKKTRTLKFGPHIALPVLRHFGRLDELQRMVGPLAKLPPNRLPEALALAVALASSWNLQNLTPIARHFGINLKALRKKLTADLAKEDKSVQKSA